MLSAPATGGDLCRALPGNACLAWYHLGHRIALDVARALHYLHSHEVCVLWRGLLLLMMSSMQTHT